MSQDSFQAASTLSVDGREYHYYSLEKAARELGDVHRLPLSLKVLLENLLRHEDGKTVTAEDIRAVAGWLRERRSTQEIGFRPARVLMQDFTGVPAVVDLAAMRDAVVAAGADPERISPLTPVDLVIDHSVMVDRFASSEAFQDNVRIEMERNHERYSFLRWGQTAFDNFRVVPPGTGICHQVNLEYLGKVVWTREEEGRTWAFPDSLVGMDSHTPMINGLGILGWGVGGIEAEAAMLGQPLSMLIPEVVGVRLSGRLREGVTATDLVLTVTELLRKHGVVGKFVEYFGPGLKGLPLADRATIANMAPEYGATCGFFPVDSETLDYMRLTGCSEEHLAVVEQYLKENGMFYNPEEDTVYSDVLHLDISPVEHSLAGPKRPQDLIPQSEMKDEYRESVTAESGNHGHGMDESEFDKKGTVNFKDGRTAEISTGDLVIAAITSCTNTSNPYVMLGAGLLAKNAVEKGLEVPAYVKTSLAPGSKVVTGYLEDSGLQEYLDKLGFNLVGYGCTTRSEERRVEKEVMM